jgi:hypothetical protein
MAGVPREIRARAKRETTWIFDSAGVDLVWWDVDAGCNVPFKDRSFIVVLTSEPLPGWNEPNATGFAAVRSGAYRRAYVFYDRVRAAALAFTKISLSETTGIILGHVVAHELGHLLLPGDAHSLTGIMRDKWNYRLSEEAAAGRLLFTPDQSKLIRKELHGK